MTSDNKAPVPDVERSSTDAESAEDLRTNTQFLINSTGTDDPPPPIKGLPRLMALIMPANLCIFLLWGAIPQILLPQQITLAFGDDGGANVANLAIVSTIGAFSAMLAQPIAGEISDRTRSRFGRRAPWIVLGGLAGSLALVGLAFADSLVGFIIAWTLVQVCFNFAQGPLSAIMPDRVPLKRRGTFSALFGLGLMVGSVAGQIIGALFFGSITFGYVFFALLALVFLGLFVVMNPDYASVNLRTEPFRLRAFLGMFWVNPIKYPDFFWAFTGRLLLFTGYFAVTGYQLYLLQYYFHVERPEIVIPVLAGLGLVGTVVATLISGPLSDKVGRRKPFVIASGVVVTVAFVVPWLWQDLAAWAITVVLAGFGFGMYQAVDTALISQVLPSAKSFGKDLGVINIAATLPQTIAPGLSGAIVLVAGYQGLFPVAIVIGIMGAVAVMPIKSAR